MNMTLENIKQAAQQLTVRKKTVLAHELLKDVDESENEDVEALWTAEAERRCDAYLRGEIEALPGDEAMARLRSKLR